MTHQLTQKEQSLLQDQMKHEEICIRKYTEYANLTQSPELRNLFYELAQEEQEHVDILNRYLGGQSSAHQSKQHHHRQHQKHQAQQQHPPMFGVDFETASLDSSYHGQTGAVDDAAICQDMLMTEKYLSNTYDTTVFESVNPQLRQDLQKIQNDEQNHGKKIFDYMHKHGYYNPQ